MKVTFLVPSEGAKWEKGRACLFSNSRLSWEHWKSLRLFLLWELHSILMCVVYPDSSKPISFTGRSESVLHLELGSSHHWPVNNAIPPSPLLALALSINHTMLVSDILSLLAASFIDVFLGSFILLFLLVLLLKFKFELSRELPLYNSTFVFP